MDYVVYFDEDNWKEEIKRLMEARNNDSTMPKFKAFKATVPVIETVISIKL
jgi:hypothetical protein